MAGFVGCLWPRIPLQDGESLHLHHTSKTTWQGGNIFIVSAFHPAYWLASVIAGLSWNLFGSDATFLA